MVLEGVAPHSLGLRASLSNLREPRPSTPVRHAVRHARSTVALRHDANSLGGSIDIGSIKRTNGLTQRPSIEFIPDYKSPRSPDKSPRHWGKRDVSPGIQKRVSSNSYILNLRKKRSIHALRQYHSRLDLLDSQNLTSFPTVLEPESPQKPIEDDNLSIYDDYISDGAINQVSSPIKMRKNACVFCSRLVDVDHWFTRHNICCKMCIQEGAHVTNFNKNLIKIESEDHKSLYYVIGELKGEDGLYDTLSRKLRWRWRWRGLI